MNLIVFDLEWNIGYQPKTFLYHGAELTLRGEIIQIGAVRINARGDVLDTFEVNLRPRIFRKLQHHIAKVTGLSQGDLDAGLPMREGLQKFLDWAGPDAELAEWGLDDVPVLKQNLFLVGLDENWPDRWYDLQRIFLQAYPRREGEGLTLERKIRAFLTVSLRVYRVPQEEIERIIRFVEGMNVRAMAERVMHTLFEALAMRYEFSLAEPVFAVG